MFVKLKDVATFHRGLTYKKSDEVASSSNIVLRANNIDLSTFKLNFNDLRYIRDSIEIPDSKIVKKDSILICIASGSKSHLGKVALIDQEYGYAFGGFMGMLLPKTKDIDIRYLFKILTGAAFRSLIDSLTDGANINNLKFSLIEDFSFDLPPLEEQYRIIAKLDAAFEKIDEAIKFTEDNLTNSFNLFGSLLQNAMYKYSDVETGSISVVADIEYGLTEKSKSQGDYRLIRITDIDNSGTLKQNEKVYVDSNVKSKKYILSKGDLLVARTGATFGKVLYFDDDQTAVFASYLIRINFKKGIQPKLFWYFAKTPQYWKQANLLAGGAAQPQFNGGALRRIEFSFPKDITEQKKVISELDRYYEKINHLQDYYRKKMNTLKQLKVSMLSDIFSESAVK